MTALSGRLYALGLPASVPVILQTNRRTLASLTARGALRVHLGFARAPEEVLAAIVRWAHPRTRTADREAARRLLIGFPVHDYAPPQGSARRIPGPALPGDDRILARFGQLHGELNERHFAGVLGAVVFLLSSRMRRRLGEFRPGCPAHPLPEISISRRHLRRDGWIGVGETLAHEMVHQWQSQTGRRLGHDAEFRKLCSRIGIDRRATRRLDNDLS